MQLRQSGMISTLPQGQQRFTSLLKRSNHPLSILRNVLTAFAFTHSLTHSF